MNGILLLLVAIIFWVSTKKHMKSQKGGEMTLRRGLCIFLIVIALGLLSYGIWMEVHDEDDTKCEDFDVTKCPTGKKKTRNT